MWIGLLFGGGIREKFDIGWLKLPAISHMQGSPELPKPLLVEFRSVYIYVDWFTFWRRDEIKRKVWYWLIKIAGHITHAGVSWTPKTPSCRVSVRLHLCGLVYFLGRDEIKRKVWYWLIKIAGHITHAGVSWTPKTPSLILIADEGGCCPCVLLWIEQTWIDVYLLYLQHPCTS